jgi:hypothetical protein
MTTQNTTEGKCTISHAQNTSNSAQRICKRNMSDTAHEQKAVGFAPRKPLSRSQFQVSADN